MSPLEYIIEKAVEANPSIKELTFGCEILNKHLNQRLLVTHLSSKGDCINCFYLGESNTTWIWKKYLTEETFEIIGREVRLADILLAIQCVGKNMRFMLTNGGQRDNLLIRCDNIFSGKSGDEYDTETIFWNLKQDDIRLQSPETQLFIARLLGYKE